MFWLDSFTTTLLQHWREILSNILQKSCCQKRGEKIIAYMRSLLVNNGNLFGTATEVFIPEESSFYFNINVFATRQDQYIFKKKKKEFVKSSLSKIFRFDAIRAIAAPYNGRIRKWSYKEERVMLPWCYLSGPALAPLRVQQLPALFSRCSHSRLRQRAAFSHLSIFCHLHPPTHTIRSLHQSGATLPNTIPACCVLVWFRAAD